MNGQVIRFTHPKRVNLGIHEFGADLEGGDLVQRVKNKRLVVFFNSLYEVLGSTHDQMWWSQVLDVTQPMANQK